MEQPGVVAGNFALSFSLNFLGIFVLISGSIWPITLIWASLERSFPPAEVEYRWCQFWSKVVTSEVEERPRFVTAGYGRHRSQLVISKININQLKITIKQLSDIDSHLFPISINKLSLILFSNYWMRLRRITLSEICRVLYILWKPNSIIAYYSSKIFPHS